MNSRKTAQAPPGLRVTLIVVLAAAVGLTMTACGGSQAEGPPTASPADLGLTTDAVVADGEVQDPTVAIDPRSGVIYVAWAERTGGKGSDDHEHHGGNAASDETELHIHLARSRDGGETFSAPALVSDPGGDAYSHSGGPPQVVVGNGGEVYVSWVRNEDYPGLEYGRSDVLLARSSDGGKSFGSPDLVVRGEGVVSTNFHNLFIGRDGDLSVGWLDYRRKIGARKYAPVQVRVASSDDGGKTFSKSALVDELSCECCRPDFAVDGDELLLGWRKIFPRGELAQGQDPAEVKQTPVRDVVIARSGDDGQHWGAPGKIHDDGWVVAQCPHSGPVIDVDARGDVHAAWYTGQDDGPGVYYATSKGAGEPFGEPRALLAGTSNPASVASLEVDEGGDSWITWDTVGRQKPAAWIAKASPGDDSELVTGRLGSGSVPRLATGGERIVAVWLDGRLIRTLSGRAGG